MEKKRERRKKHKQRRKEKKREEKEVSSKADCPKEKFELKDPSNIQIIKKGDLNYASNTLINSPNQSKSDTDSDTPEIDLGSAFCSKVKQKVEKCEARSRKSSGKVVVNGDDLISASKRSTTPHVKDDSIICADPENAETCVGENSCNTNTTVNPKLLSSQPCMPSEEDFLKSQEHARKGNEFAQFGKLQNAIEEYTKAIALNKIDHRCFGNRSYCFHSLKKFDDALNDANSAISLVPNEPKGYFRKAKALCGLKRFSEAEHSLSKILELDPSCSEAAHELFEVRLLQLQDFGFDRRACEHALTKSKNDIQGAIEFLLSSQFKDNMCFTSSDYDKPPPQPVPIPTPIYPNISHIPPSQMSSFFPMIPTGTYTASPIRIPNVAPSSRPTLVNTFPQMQVPFPRPQNLHIKNIPVSNILRMHPPPMTPHMQHPLQTSKQLHPHVTLGPNTAAVRPNSKQQHNQSMISKVSSMNNSNISDQNVLNGNSIRKFDPRDYSLWIGHFDPKKITEKDLYDVFAIYGSVSGVVIIKTHGKPLAYSFVHFMKHEDAKRAFNAAQNHVIQGISLDVNWNKNPTIECEHWLRGNCPYSNCHYLHVSDHHFTR